MHIKYDTVNENDISAPNMLNIFFSALLNFSLLFPTYVVVALPFFHGTDTKNHGKGVQNCNNNLGERKCIMPKSFCILCVPFFCQL